MNRLYFKNFLSVLLLSLSNAAYAAITPPQLPSSADVGRVKQQVESNISIPDVRSPVIGMKDVSTMLLPIPKGADNVSFTLRSVSISGSTVFENGEMLGAMQQRIGSSITLTEVYKLTNSITQKYWDEGYAFSRAMLPEQNIQSGQITIHVIEGYLYEVQNLEAIPLSSFRKKMQALTMQRPIKRRALEEAMLQVNVLAGQRIGGILTQDKKAKKEEAFALNMQVESLPSSPVYSVGLGNVSSRYNGPWSTSITAQVPDLLVPYGTTVITASTSIPFQRQEFLGVTQLIPLATGTSATVGANISRNKPGYLLKPQKFEGNSHQLNFGLSQDIFRSQNENLVSTFAFDYINSENDVLGTQFFDDRMRVLRAGFNWDKTDEFAGKTYANITFSQGLDILDASRKGSPFLSRAEGESDFTKFEAQVARQQEFGRGFLGIFSTRTQYAPNPLLSAEEFGYGGSSLGRGYDSSELAGDSGITGAVELRYYNVPSLMSDLTLVPYTFFDIGKVWNNDRGGENLSGASAGLGALLGYDEDVSLNLAVALPLRREANTPPSYANGNSPRFLFQLQKSF